MCAEGWYAIYRTGGGAGRVSTRARNKKAKQYSTALCVSCNIIFVREGGQFMLHVGVWCLYKLHFITLAFDSDICQMRVLLKHYDLGDIRTDPYLKKLNYIV